MGVRGDGEVLNKMRKVSSSALSQPSRAVSPGSGASPWHFLLVQMVEGSDSECTHIHFAFHCRIWLTDGEGKPSRMPQKCNKSTLSTVWIQPCVCWRC